MRSALIGYTGFIGGNLRQQRSFDAMFNSSNIDDFGGTWDLVVCAGARAEKWKANADPEADRAGIERLVHSLERAAIDRLVLISTVDVFESPLGVDEESPVGLDGTQAYGRNRRWLETVVANETHSLVVRLPGMYGPGLKKNAIYDLLHDNDVQKIDSRGVFQFYNVARLWRDVGAAMDAGLSLVHLVTEPVSIADVARVAFDRDFVNEVAARPVRYDVRTRHSSVFTTDGRDGPYIEDKAQELAGIAAWVAEQRRS